MRDSVRENLFNLLGPRIEGTTIIDPFGGTGILPAESFSRGARSAVIMDFDRRAIRQIQENLTHLKVLEKGNHCCRRRLSRAWSPPERNFPRQ